MSYLRRTLLVILVPVTVLGQEVAVIPDPNLAADLRRALHFAEGEDILVSDLEGMTRIIANNVGASGLEGLQYAVNLLRLGVTGGQVVDLTPLTGLTLLEELRLDLNQITDIGPLANLKNLRRLHLRTNRISDLSPLAGLSGLRELSLDDNEINDLSGIEGLLDLEELSFGDNEVLDLTPLTGLSSLIVLRFDENLVSDLRPLRSHTGLVWMSANDNLIAGLDGLEDLANLEILYLGNNEIIDISLVPRVEELSVLELRGNLIESIEGLGNVGRIGRLDLSRNFIHDLTPLLGVDLVRLTVDDNRLESLAGLERDGGGPSTISAQRNAITDIGALAGLDGLVFLDLTDNSISDISQLPRVENVSNWQLDGNLIEEIESLSGLVNVLSLDLSRNFIQDLSPLFGVNVGELKVDNNLLQSLEGLGGNDAFELVISASGNMISDISSLSNVERIVELNLANNLISDLTELPEFSDRYTLYITKQLAKNITRINFRNNLIENIGPLVANLTLDEDDKIDLRGNPLSDQALTVDIRLLRQRGIDVRWDGEPLFRCAAAASLPNYPPRLSLLAGDFIAILLVLLCLSISRTRRNIPIAANHSRNSGWTPLRKA